ncbi:hypothetical protein ONE63_002238 [Megalurothrips usitatus]|uniref:Disks large homolog 5 n=1 Tax=Megalurothrips usitatus TaxID=439358 RepID=A0AAV7XC18_9NEOP|nr:hypothetical protein ONE63_002238 [Megalurothrips usitatus]
MASGASSLESHSGGSPRDYDDLKQQCDKAMHELQLLRRQHSETIRRCDHTMKELDYYRGQHRAAMSQLEAAATESSTLRSKYSELASEKLRLERDMQTLQLEIGELRSQDVIGSEGGTADTLNQHYLTACEKYEMVKDEYESLRKRYDDLIASHSAAVNKLELAQEEVGRLKKQCEELVQERNLAVRERTVLQQQCTAAIRQWDIALRERNEYREALAKAQQQHEEAVKEINQAMAVRMKASKDLKRLTEERNAAMQEYSLIMSERDTVHKEMEKLTDDLTQAFNKNRTLEVENKDSLEEKKALSYQVETLKREIASALHDRDKALKECNDLREKYGDFIAQKESNSGGLAAFESNTYIRERDTGRSDQAEVSTSTRDMYGKSQRERMDNLDQANQELEKLRKQVDKLQAELQESTQEAEVSKRRRDWAFSERDKIVLERESIRTLCDKLRKERDRAVSDLAEALRDSDDIKKQRNEASKELKQLKEKMEAQMEKESRSQQFRAAGHNHSHDSAIDSDLQEWETEMLEIDLSGLASDDDLGFDLVGGRDDPQYSNDTGIYVSSIAKGSVADGKLKVNDCISRVNNVDCSNVSKRMVLETVRAGGRVASMVVRRRRFIRSIYTTQLHMGLDCEHGLSLETGIYICKISPGSAAAKEGNLAVGDRVLSINNKPMDGLSSAREAIAILEEHADSATITTMKGSASSSHSSCEEERGFSAASSSCKESVQQIREHRAFDRSPTGSSSPSSLSRPHGTHGAHGSHSRDHKHSACQTDGIGIRTDLLDHSRFSERSVYPVNKSSVDKVSSNSGSSSTGWGELIKEKFDHVRNRCRREYNFQDKNKDRNTSPVGPEEEVIAELDSVIDSYHGPNQAGQTSGSGLRSGTGTVAMRRRNRRKEEEKNGGTWPRARVGTITRHSTGSVLHPRRPKERVPIRVLLNDPPAPDCDHLSDASLDMSGKSSNTSKDTLMFPFGKKKGSNGDSGGMHGRMQHYPPCPSDSESNASPVPSSHGRFVSALYPRFPVPVPVPVPHPHPHHPHAHAIGPHPSLPSRFPGPRYHSPVHHLPSSPSGESIGLPETNRSGYIFEPPYSPQQQSYHSHSPSDVHYVKPQSLLQAHSHPNYRVNDDLNISYHSSGFESGTFPRKKENPRFRIPSNPSVTSKVSTSSMERSSERDSPMPTFRVDVLSRASNRGNKRNSLPDYWSGTHQSGPQQSPIPAPGDLRRVHIDKSVEPLGIQIKCLDGGGVFVSTVSVNSLASKVGLQVGDQLLEVCGINMRSATYQLAANVLRQCGNSITMLVQYSPEKYKMENSASSSGDESHRSDSPTPRNSPHTARKLQELGPNSLYSSNHPNEQNTLTRSQIAQATSTLQRQKVTKFNTSHSQRSSMVPTLDDGNKSPTTAHEPRLLMLETRKCSNLGISLVGGNAVGIFVHSVQPDSLACEAGLRTGDQILEYNSTDLRQATAEEAAYELAKPADKVTVLVHYNMDKYNKIKDKPGDSFYIRALFDRQGDTNDSMQLRFHKDDVLFIDNTMFNGKPGNWRAWCVDEEGNIMQQCGIIPSKYKVEEQLLRRSLGDLETDVRRGSTTARRSFFRRKKHQRSASQDSKELASFSSINLGWYSDSGNLHDEAALASYQRVERLNYTVFRPVLIVGPLADCVTERLLQDFPQLFIRCTPDVMHCSSTDVEKGIANGVLVDFRKKGGSFFECTSVAAIRDICDKKIHCILDISLASVERLHRHNLYPIILLIKFKSTKQIKEVKDTRYSMDKVSAKAAKEMYEHSAKLETEYRHLISAVIPAGVNVAYMCTQIKAAVNVEQNKTLWVPI